MWIRAIYAIRGFGIVVGVHAIYDVVVVDDRGLVADAKDLVLVLTRHAGRGDDGFRILWVQCFGNRR